MCVKNNLSEFRIEVFFKTSEFRDYNHKPFCDCSHETLRFLKKYETQSHCASFIVFNQMVP